MMSAVLVTLAMYLLELCSTSPVYNMQPAFITNTLGATTGRNIRNLPCISRKNNNQHGVCMFAIDCLKANGTHLGTCIDRFYFGSCCHIDPVHDIIENTIESDVIPPREPPLRITNTTTPQTVTSSMKPSEVDISSKLPSTISATGTTEMLTTPSNKVNNATTIGPPTTNKNKIELSSTTAVPSFGDKITTNSPNSTVEITTVPQKLQTFQVVNGSPLDRITTKVPPLIVKTTTPSTKLTTSRPGSEKPTQNKLTTQKPLTTKSTVKSTTKSTLRPKPTRPAATTKPTIKLTPKPIKPTTKPFRITTTKKPVTTNSPIVTKLTKRPAITISKPTKKVTTASSTITKIQSTIASSTTQKPTTTPTPKTTTTTKVTTTPKVTTTTATVNTSKKPIELTTWQSSVSTTTVSNDIPLKINITQFLETVNGNPATNEIEATKPVVPLITSKPTSVPEVATWTVADNKNYSTTTTESILNNTTEDWIPITTPDGWVLLPSVSPNASETIDSTNQTVSSSSTDPSPITTSSPSTFQSTEGKPLTTYIPLETTTQQVLISPNATSERPSDISPITSLPTESSTENTVGLSDNPVNMTDYTEVCGRRMFPGARIVGGEKSSFGKWPWQISLRQWRTSTYLHKCGAALLNENWAITAAHCVDNIPPSDLLLRLGEHDLSTESEPYLHQERRVQIVASHPHFDPRTFEYDLALLRFYEPVTFQPNILPICVPQTEDNFIGRTAHVTGWGRLYEDGPLPSILQEVSVPVINNTLCEAMYRSAGYIEHIPHIFICAGWRKGGFDSCEGDSGGPMVIQREDKRFVLAGVISWGIGCAEPNQPGVYTRISEFRDWINQILQF